MGDSLVVMEHGILALVCVSVSYTHTNGTHYFVIFMSSLQFFVINVINIVCCAHVSLQT